MSKMQAAQIAIAKRRAEVGKLKQIISDQDPLATAVRDANSLVMIGQGLDVYGLVTTGIDLINVINDALDVTRSLQLLHDSELGAMTLKQSGNIANYAASGTNSVMAVSRYLFAANVLGVLAQYVGVWISLGAGYAQAKAQVLTEHAMSGASRGVMLGANDAHPSYVTKFQLRVKPSYPMYREIEAAAMNMFNIALAAGYAHGKNLSHNQKVNLGKFLVQRMTPGQRSYFSGRWSNLDPSKKEDYYIETAAIFRRLLLR